MDSDLDSLKSSDLKTIIYYARFGRILKQNKILFVIQCLFYTSLSVFFLFHIEQISLLMAKFSLKLLPNASLVKKEIFEKISLYYLSYEGRLPTIIESTFYFIVSLLILILNSKTNFFSLPIKIWVNFIFLILLISSVFFILMPYAFPYSLNDFSLLYIIVQVGIFVFLILVLGFVLSLLSFSWWLIFFNFVIVLFTLFYSFFFGSLRYVVFLFLLKTYSSIWMANCFFNFGPLLDLIYIAGIYSFYISILSKKVRQNVKVWRWIY